MSSPKAMSTLLAATISAAKTPTPASFSSWDGIPDKAFAGDMYCRIFNRLLKCSVRLEKVRGKEMKAMWDDQKHKDLFAAVWKPTVQKPKKRKADVVALDVSPLVLRTILNLKCNCLIPC